MPCAELKLLMSKEIQCKIDKEWQIKGKMQNLNQNSEFSFSNFVRQLKPSELIVLVPLLLYLIGFVITNLYLGTLGIVNLDLFRVKYVLVGTLFIVYYGVLIVMLQGAFDIIYKIIGVKEKFIKLLWYSVQIYGLPYLLVLLLKSISGVTVPPTIFLPKQNVPNNSLNIVPHIKDSELISFFVMVIVLVALIAYLRAPIKKDENKKSIFAATLVFIKELLFFVFASSLFIFSALYIKNYLIKLINEFSVNVPERPALSWENLVSLHSSLYLLIIMFMFVVVSLIHKQLVQVDGASEAKDLSVDSFIPQKGLNTFIVGIVFVLALTLYTLAVYPGLPQQVGGGAVIPVSVVTSSHALEAEFSVCLNNIFLVERSSSNTIFLVLDNALNKISFVELNNSEITAIYYYPDCTN